MIEVACFSDPGCPWAYSALPAHAVLRWRYGSQLRWRMVMIGLAEDPERYVRAGYTPARAVQGWIRFRERYGMPFATQPRARVIATSRACRAVIATRLIAPGLEQEAFRALQFAWFTTSLLLDEDEGIGCALAKVEGLDAAAIVKRLDEPAIIGAYQADKELARAAGGSPTEFQGKARQTDGPVRYSAPSLVFSNAKPRGAGGGGVGRGFGDGSAGVSAGAPATGPARVEAGGFQPVEAYDVLIANLDPGLEREPPPEDPLLALARFPHGLVTQEVASIMAANNEPPDRGAAERALIELVASGRVSRTPLGDDALWTATSATT